MSNLDPIFEQLLRQFERDYGYNLGLDDPTVKLEGDTATVTNWQSEWDEPIVGEQPDETV